jgi:hypothetical protein
MSGPSYGNQTLYPTLKKNKSWSPIMPKQRERCLRRADDVRLSLGNGF